VDEGSVRLTQKKCLSSEFVPGNLSSLDSLRSCMQVDTLNGQHVESIHFYSDQIDTVLGVLDKSFQAGRVTKKMWTVVQSYDLTVVQSYDLFHNLVNVY
jgi:hypothetical protein